MELIVRWNGLGGSENGRVLVVGNADCPVAALLAGGSPLKALDQLVQCIRSADNLSAGRREGRWEMNNNNNRCQINQTIQFPVRLSPKWLLVPNLCPVPSFPSRLAPFFHFLLLIGACCRSLLNPQSATTALVLNHHANCVLGIRLADGNRGGCGGGAFQANIGHQLVLAYVLIGQPFLAEHGQEVVDATMPERQPI